MIKLKGFILAGLACALPAAADYSAWSGHRSIVLNTSATGANVTGDVHDFPVLIRLGRADSAILSAAGTGGASIRFSKADSVTPLPYQIESWDSASATIWVKVDTIKGNNATQSILIHWDNDAAVSESNGAAVFDTADGYRGVWHLASDSVGVSRDATANQNHATQQGAATATTGIANGARRFNASGAGDIDTVGINETFDMSADDQLTVSAWVRREGTGGSAFEGIAGVFDWTSNGAGVNNRMYSLVHNSNNGFSFHVSSNGGDGANEIIVNSNIIGEPTWTHAAATVDGANINVYVNGVSVAQQAYTGDIYFPTDLTGVGPFTIGMLDDNGSERQFFNGSIDEVRLSGVARSANWLKLSYESQKAVNTLTNIGLPSVPGAPTAVAGVAGGVNTGTVTVTWTAPADNGGAQITSYKAMVSSNGADSARSCTTTLTTGTLGCIITGLSSGARHAYVVRAYNAVGAGALSAPSDTVTAPLPVLGGGALMLNVGSFTNGYTFRLADRLIGGTDRLEMRITDVTGKTMWSRSIAPSQASREITWNGVTSTGARASAGVYFVRVFTTTDAGKLEAVQGGVKLGQ